MSLKRNENKDIKVTSFSETEPTAQEKERQNKIKENEAYIKYIKEHDKVAYERYLSYSSYLRH